MKLCKWLVRGLGIACLVLGGLLSGAGVVTLTARVAYAQAPGVVSIVVQGNQRVEADTIRSYFRPGPSGRLDAFQIDEGVKALYATGLFRDVRPTIQGGRLITVVENPVINRIHSRAARRSRTSSSSRDPVEGARHALASRRASRHCAPGRSLSAQRPLHDPDRAQDHRASEQPRRPHITKSPKAKTGVKTIEFVGNRAYSAYRLKDVIKTSRPEFSHSCRPPTSTIRIGSRRIANYCAGFISRHGYIDVRVVSAVGEFDPNRKGFVIFHDRGRRAVSRRNSGRSIDDVAARSVALEVETAAFSGDIYNAEAVEEDGRGHDHRGREAGRFRDSAPRAVRDVQARMVNISLRGR